jgi:hypothetical protein
MRLLLELNKLCRSGYAHSPWRLLHGEKHVVPGRTEVGGGGGHGECHYWICIGCRGEVELDVPLVVVEVVRDGRWPDEDCPAQKTEEASGWATLSKVPGCDGSKIQVSVVLFWLHGGVTLQRQSRTLPA